MANIDVATKTQLATHQKIAVSFILGTATMVLVSAILAGIITLTLSDGTTTSLPVGDTDRTFQT